MATEEKLREYLKRATVDLAEARRRIGELEGGNHDPIAIVGMSCRYPGSPTVEDYWELLLEGRSGVVEVPEARWNVDDYYNPDRRVAGSVYTREGAFLSDIAGWDAEFFGISPQEALRMDPQQRLLMELLWEALENAAISPARLSGSRTGVLVGLMDNSQYGRLQVDRYGAGIAADPYFGAGVSTSVVAGRLAYQFDLRGPAITLDTACSSSLVSVHLAGQALRRGECDLAVAAGAFLIMQPDTYVQSCATSMLAADGRCKTFDSGADGYVMGEGGGLVVLERLSDAVRNGRRIRAVLRGSAVNQDGRSNGLSAPSRSAQVDVIRRALADARVDPDDVDYVEAHGSGTQLGDAIELSALHDVFSGRSAQRPLHVGAVKTNIGHTQSAAGVAGLIKTVLLLENGLAPTNLNFSEPAAATPADGTIRPLTEAVPFLSNGRRKIAGVSGFGWSGTNGHLVIEAPPVPEESDAASRPAAYPVLVSAASDTALRTQLERLSGWLGARPELDLADVAHTLSSGRAEHDYRRALVCTDLDDAVSRLAGAASDARPRRATGRPRVAFLLPGIGDQYVGLGRELHRSEPVYADAVDRCIAVVHERCGIDLRPMFFPVDDQAPAVGDLAALLGRVEAKPGEEFGEEPINQPEIAHPFLFIVEYALAKLLAHRGVTADVLVGYSLGEYVAACLAGVFSLEDALYLVVERARLIETVPAGRMVAVAADEEAVRAAIRSSGAEVDVAALNGPSMTVLSGAAKEIDAIARLMHDTGIASRPLRTTHAFHSSLLEPARDKLAALLDTVTLHAASVTIVSNRTGDLLTAEQATDRDYWADHLVNPVRFAQSVQHCVAQGVDVFVELGAGQTLGGLVRRNLSGESGVAVLGTLPARWSADEHPCARTELLVTCGRLWELGVALDWSGTRSPGAKIVTLPTYPFERTRFWPEPGGVAALTPGVSRPTEPTDLCYAPAWRHDGSRARPAALRLPGTLVIFTDRDGIGSALADRAVAGGTAVVEVVAGTELRREGRRVVIDPGAPEHYREIVSGLETHGPLHVVHMWSLLATGQSAPYESDDELRDSIRHGFDSLLLTVQACGEPAARQGVELVTVSQGALEVLGGDVPAPYRAAVHGLGRVVRHEYSGLTWRGVDLDPELVTADDAAGHLAHELSEPAQPNAGVAGWRRGRRWVQEWAEVATPADPEPVWRADGVYLITGGTRGLGLALARHLVAQGVRRLALVSRSASRDDAGGTDPRAARTRADVAALEAAGAEILLLAADAGVPDQLREALRRCREHFGALHGVVHAAGAPASGMVARQSVAGAGAVLAPKVLAIGPLAELVGPGTPPEQRPELLVLYSSAITVFGGIGEGDYCAANSVLDSYGAALSAAAPSTRVLTVAWGPWLHDDWQLAGPAGGLAERARAYRERYGFPSEAGCALLDRLVQSGHGSVIAVRQPMQAALQEWSALLDIDALVGANPVAPPGERFPRPQLRTDFVAARTALEAVIAEVWGQYLGIDQVGIHDPFFDLGGNSLVGMAMVHAVENELDTHIAPAVLFEHPTVAEFAVALGRDENSDDDAGQARLVISSDRGQRRRRARAGVRK